jgi:hypothetical protein
MYYNKLACVSVILSCQPCRLPNDYMKVVPVLTTVCINFNITSSEKIFNYNKYKTVYICLNRSSSCLIIIIIYCNWVFINFYILLFFFYLVIPPIKMFIIKQNSPTYYIPIITLLYLYTSASIIYLPLIYTVILRQIFLLSQYQFIWKV